MINAPATAVIHPDLVLQQVMMSLLMAKPSIVSKINGLCMRAPIRRLMMAYLLKVQAQFTPMAKQLRVLVIPFLVDQKHRQAVKLFFRGK